MTVYRSRSAWTSRPASGDGLGGVLLKGVAVHWPGTRTSRFGIESADAVARRIRHYRDYHVNTRGWRDLGYNIIIDQAGRVWQGRTTLWRGNLVGAHCASPSNPDANHEYVGVLFMLGADEKPTAAMQEAFRDWRHNHFLKHWPGRTDLREHSRVPGADTACAGPQVRALLATGALHVPPNTEDDMPLENDDVRKVWLTDNIVEAPPGYEHTGNTHWSPASVIRSAQLYARTAAERGAKTATELAAIKAAVSSEPVDVAALASELAPLLVAPIVAAIPDTTEEQIEAAIRNVLGSLDE